MKKKEGLYFIDNVRGLAALLITVFHYFGDTDNLYLDNTLLEDISVYAGDGVLIFFIVSGFIMPYSLLTKKYKIQAYPKFLVKRILRLDPPYLLSVVLIVLYTTAIAYKAGSPFPYSVKQLALHIGYLNGIFNVEWVNIVYWSLAIEFQYYILLGLLFPLMVQNTWLRFTLLLILLVLTTIFKTNPIWVTHYAHFFAIGMICNFYYTKLLSHLQTLLLAIFTLLLWIIDGISNHDFYIISVTVGLFIVLKNFNKYLHFLGMISYSLYLTHTYTGLLLIAYIRMKTENLYIEYAIGLLSMIIALAGAYAFYLIIEKPSKRWSTSIKY